MTTRYCGHCHTCGTALHKVLDGEEWCPKCRKYVRYQSHGWIGLASDAWPCPEPQAGATEQATQSA